MKVDVVKYTFAGVAAGSPLGGPVDVRDVEGLSAWVNVASVTGAPTSFRVQIALSIDGVVLPTPGSNSAVRKTADMAAGVAYYPADRREAAPVVLDTHFFNASPQLMAYPDFTGGTAPTMTGTIYYFLQRR